MPKKIFTKIALTLGLLVSCNIYANIDGKKFHDYRTQTQSSELQKMQEFHLQQAKLKINKQEYAYAWGDLAYLLCQVPNHHIALQYMFDIAPKINKQSELQSFIQKAAALFPDDQIVQALQK
jgi:predicted Zn-dependent protease